MTKVRISEILRSTRRIRGFGGQITKDNLPGWINENVLAETTLTRTGAARLRAGSFLPGVKFNFRVPRTGLGWIEAMV